MSQIVGKFPAWAQILNDDTAEGQHGAMVVQTGPLQICKIYFWVVYICRGCYRILDKTLSEPHEQYDG